MGFRWAWTHLLLGLELGLIWSLDLSLAHLPGGFEVRLGSISWWVRAPLFGSIFHQGLALDWI